jgi:hypothetical protein
MTLDAIVTLVVVNVCTVGPLLIAFRVNIEHRLTKLETHVERLLKVRHDSRG